MNVPSANLVQSAADRHQDLDAVEDFWPALVGELAGPLAHEVNNFLNNIVLELAIVDSKLPQTTRSELDAMRRHATRLTSLVHRFQAFARLREAELRPVSLNPIVREAAAAWEKVCGHTDTGHHQLVLAADLPPVLAIPGDLQRLLFLLFKNTAGALNTPRVRTQLLENTVRLSLEKHHHNGAPAPSPEDASLELTACRAIVHRFGGKLNFHDPRAGGTYVVLELATSRPNSWPLCGLPAIPD